MRTTRMMANVLFWCGANTLFFALLGPGFFINTATAARSACFSVEDEDRLKKREIAALGLFHADEHARARAEACDIERKGGTQATTASELTVSAVGPPSEVGQWSQPIFIPVIGANAVLLPSGKVMFWYFDNTNLALNRGLANLWDPVSNTNTTFFPPEDLFCGGQTLLHDGRLLVAGGNLSHGNDVPGTAYKGSRSVYTFNPFNETWKQQVSMAQGRWYPTLTRLGNNQVVITSGWTDNGQAIMNPDVEVFTPDSNIDGDNGTIQKVGTHDPSWFYPYQFLLPDGRMLQAGPAETNASILNPADWSWSRVSNLLQSHYFYGNGVPWPAAGPGGSSKVMIIGGKDSVAFGGSNTFAADARDPVSNFTEMFDAANPTGGWQALTQMPQPRARQNTVFLPDGTFLTVGGNSGDPTQTGSDQYLNSQKEALLYRPPTPTTPGGSWTPMAAQQKERAYHSTALLLPDGRVVSAGDDRISDQSQHYIEIFSPPYLFKGERPVIVSMPSQVGLGTKFTINATTTIQKVVLIAPGATTHANDMNQRYVELAISRKKNQAEATIPASPNIVPRGYYMLFVLNKGVPSQAKWLKVF
jgi:hypothetical protein